MKKKEDLVNEAKQLLEKELKELDELNKKVTDKKEAKSFEKMEVPFKKSMKIIQLGELHKDPRSTRVMLACVESLLSFSGVSLEDIYKLAYEKYSGGRHKSPARIRYEVRKTLLYLQRKGIV
jgi:predicted Holliday junction resolvase-like endonuclease